MLDYSASIFEDFDHGFNLNWQGISDDHKDNESWQIENNMLWRRNITYTLKGVVSYVYLTDFMFNEFSLEVDVKIRDVGTDARVGVVFGLLDNNFYRFRIYLSSQTADLWCRGWFSPTHSPSEWCRFVSTRLEKKIYLQKWYRLRVVVNNERWQFYIDGNKVIDLATDTYFQFLDICDINGKSIGSCSMYLNSCYPRNAYVGLYCVEADVSFDNVRICNLTSSVPK
ncbi:MAG: family 16 glycoside hydrolase [Candidatus Edwardsbacteria bacterium]